MLTAQLQNLVVAVALFACCSMAATAGDRALVFQQSGSQPEMLAPLMTVNADAEVIDNEFIVMYNAATVRTADSITDSIIADIVESTMTTASSTADMPDIIHRYRRGFAVRFSPGTTEAALNVVRRRPEVDFVEPNQVVHAFEDLGTQYNPPSWGLARVWQHKFNQTKEYKYPTSAGEGVDAYIIDTGINIDHKDFEGRAVWGLTAPRNDNDKDGNGHGTHVAGTVAGATYGVAKKAKVIAVKVLRSNGSGSIGDVIKGIEWSAEQAAASKRKSVANMSLGGGSSRALDAAVESAIESGLHFAIAAGNSNDDACRYSPAEVEAAVTVGASTKSDSRAYFSNVGKCVDIFAPGLDITSAWIGSNGASRTISGTSMAAPHVCGVMALLLADADYTTAELKDKLAEIATENALSGLPRDTVNLLLYNRVDTSSAAVVA